MGVAEADVPVALELLDVLERLSMVEEVMLEVGGTVELLEGILELLDICGGVLAVALSECAAANVEGAGVSPGKSMTVEVGAGSLYIVRCPMESGVSSA